MIGELLSGKDWDGALRAGWGALVGLFSSTVAKLILQLVMVVLFLVWVL